MARLEQIAARLPETDRVDVEAWADEPTFRVRGKVFVFTDQAALGISVKLPKDEAAAVVATDSTAEPTGYGLGRHGWVSASGKTESVKFSVLSSQFSVFRQVLFLRTENRELGTAFLLS